MLLNPNPATADPIGLPHFRKMGEDTKAIVKMSKQIGRPNAEILKELLDKGESM
jgi:hypothetical protein